MIKGRTALIPKARTQKVKMALKLRAKGRHTQGLHWARFSSVACRDEDYLQTGGNEMCKRGSVFLGGKTRCQRKNM